ncbi:MAG: NAD(P)-dependent alcohol dehydrogenase [Actinomycetia bacterium]|nr:NAD(P)-dependent alcohol dehydrogenase [Actinomycetes bacterium]
MKAVTTRRYGAPDDVLALADVDDPTIADDQVLVQVHAASVNPVDWHLVRGTPYLARLKFGLRRPKVRIPGSDVAGTVRAIGPNVTSVQVGDEVFGTSFLRGFGAFAELVPLPEQLVARKPERLTFEHAAALPLAASTALQALRDHGRIAAGQRVLVVGASGGVGTFAVQLAKSFGAEVTAVCSTRNLELVRSLGADHVLDYTTTDFTAGGPRFDLILQAAGTHSPTACRRALERRGTLISISGDSTNRWIGPLDRMVAAALRTPFVSQRMTSFTVAPNRRDLDLLADLAVRGEVVPVIDRTYPLPDAPAAIRHVEDGHTRGKAVITVVPAVAPEPHTHRS